MQPPRALATLSLLAALALVAPGAFAADPPPTPDTNDFILRVSETELASVIERHSLEVVSVVESSQDAFGRLVYMVRAPQQVDPRTVLEDVRELDSDLADIEQVFLASLPESAQGLDLDQSTMAILGWVDKYGDKEKTFWEDKLNSVKHLAWGGFVEQPAAKQLGIKDAAKFKLPDGKTLLGNDVIVAIIDTGIDPDHPLLADRIVPGYDFVREEPGVPSEWADVDQSTMAILGQSTMAILGGEGVVSLNQSTMAILGNDQLPEIDPAALPASFGHGTMVAGIIHRAAPKALLMPLRTFDGDGHGSLFDIVRAIYWAVDHGAKVINMSFSLRVFSPELMRAVNYATRQGVACVASAGNESEEVMVYPAALGNTIGVASVSPEEGVSRFSNFGDDLVSVAAPGEHIITAFPGGGWAAASGTSFAAPWVSGTAALFAQMRGYQLSPMESSDAYMIGLAMAFRAKQDDKGPKRIGHGRLALKDALKFMQVVSGLK